MERMITPAVSTLVRPANGNGNGNGTNGGHGVNVRELNA